MERRRLTMTEVVGENVRRIRLSRRLSQEQLRVGLAERGIEWSRPTVAQMELGKRPLSVDELLVVALTLGVAPHLLLYPPPRTNVGISDKHALPNWVIAGWLFDPDDHGLSEAREVERRFAYDASDMAEELPPEDLRDMFRRMQRDRASAAESAAAQIDTKRSKTPAARS
jgi:transcriptional regulator with XRE-family HTH domain